MLKHSFLFMFIVGLLVIGGQYKTALADCTPNPAPDGSTVTCTGVETTGLVADDEVSVVNEGTILTIEDGIHADDAAQITNNGTITAVSDGIDVHDEANMVNNGDITSIENQGIEADAGLTLENNGSITAELDAISAGDSAYIINNSDIHSNNGDGIDIDGEPYSFVHNQGTITTDQGNTIEVSNPTVIINDGALDAACNAVDASDDSYIDNRGTATSENCAVIEGGDTYVSNEGEIYTPEDNLNPGIKLGDGGSVYNTGLIETTCKGVSNSEGWLIVQNHGDIISAQCDGVAGSVGVMSNNGLIDGADDGIDIDRGTVFNYDGGVIRGGDAGIDYNGGVEGDYGNIFVSNWVDSQITGNIGINAEGNNQSQSVYNQGTIEGTGGTAVNLGAGNDFFSAMFGTYAELGSQNNLQSEAIGIVNGGADEDTFELHYQYNGDDPEATHEISRIQEIANSAATQNCPCTLQFTVLGVTFNYTYTNFEKITARTTCWTFGSGCGSSEESAAPSAEIAVPAVEVAPVEVAPIITETIAPAPLQPENMISETTAPVVEAVVIEVAMVANPAPRFEQIIQAASRLISDAMKVWEML